MLKFSDHFPSKLLCTAHMYQTRQDSVPQLQKLKLIHTIKNAGSGKAQGKCWLLQENICVHGWTPPCSSVPWSAGQRKRPVPLSVKPLEEHFVCLSPSNTRQKLESLLVTMGDKKSQTSKMKQAYSWTKVGHFFFPKTFSSFVSSHHQFSLGRLFWHHIWFYLRKASHWFLLCWLRLYFKQFLKQSGHL